MEAALYHPAYGYYSGPDARGTRAGDFLTAPETHPIFARTLARQIAEMWERLDRPRWFGLREYGAGTGILGHDVLRALEADGSPVLDALWYEPVEVSGRRRELIRRRLRGAGLERWLTSAAGPFVGCVIANEFLDALPVHRLVRHDGRLQELYVTWRDGWFADEPGTPSMPTLARWMAQAGVELAESQVAEVCPAASAWVADVALTLELGYVVIIDYGHRAQELYGAQRMHGSLRTYRAHQTGSDPYRAVGRQDLTAHVDFSSLERAATAHGLDVLGRTTQGEFLFGAGLEGLLRSTLAEAADAQAYITAKASVVRLIDPRHMGRFGVLVLGRGVPADPPLSGLAFWLTRPGRAAVVQ
ncbi:SAM-dependent methyltransferase [soil metagenome]